MKQIFAGMVLLILAAIGAGVILNERARIEKGTPQPERFHENAMLRDEVAWLNGFNAGLEIAFAMERGVITNASHAMSAKRQAWAIYTNHFTRNE